MPCVKIIDLIKIYIYSRDHDPPHFHVMIAGYEELICIKDLSTYSGEIPSRYRKKVIDWAAKKREFLTNYWVLLNPKK